MPNPSSQGTDPTAPSLIQAQNAQCDEGRPSCQRCLKRNELCEGYRDDTTLLFRSENEKAARHSANYQLTRRASFGSSPRSTTSSASNKSSLKSPSRHQSQSTQSKKSSDLAELTVNDIGGLKLDSPFPWAKSIPEKAMPSAEDQAISQFFEKFVMYPCNTSSSPGFLEHLPSLFKDVQVEGRMALRWAVRAAAYAGLSNESGSMTIGDKAVRCYGLALKALGEALKDPERVPDDYTLMTVVILDMFEVSTSSSPESDH
jgi:hypothetical protein